MSLLADSNSAATAMADATIDIHRNCPGCKAELGLGDRFCPQCGARADEQQPTASYKAPQRRSSSRSGASDERFVAGQVLVERFRIVTVIGRGGMGEVYRADDLALGQSVALKFLPEALSEDADRLRRLRGEVRTARQVSHPHVCRVHDLGEANGQLFISMEFVDGQNLSALLQQINRLPEERGIEIAQQLCLGLGAIHDRGLLHRDLKPANVMLDGRGQVRITDFGLAAPAEQIFAVEVRDGTPAYQSPEQLAGRDVTARSDIYALGLILYELFTGKKAFTASERAELASSDSENPPRRPSSHVSGLSPAVEKIILKCLEKEPSDRPRTAYEVLAALPGGDPLQAALAAGQTPSPAVVADAKVEGSLHPLTAFTLLVTTLVGIGLILVFGRGSILWEQVPHKLSPRDLAARAETLIEEFGYSNAPRDIAYGLEESKEVLKILGDRDQSPERWALLATGQPPAMFFWYRQSPAWMRPLGLDESDDMAAHHGQASADNPAFSTPGMVRLCLDLEGRLIEFQALPSSETKSGPPVVLDWPSILKAAGLESMQEVADGRPGWTPPEFVDTRLAWRGVYDKSEIAVRAEAGLRDGRMVFFHAAPDQEQKEGLVLFSRDRSNYYALGWKRTFFGITAMVLLGVNLLLAWNNVRLGRANIRGTAILGGTFFAAFILMWLFSAHHVPDYLLERQILAAELGSAILWAAHLCIYYLSLEPYVRRRWPWRMVAWNRALAGRWRDPLVGRDVLMGAAVGVAVFAIYLIGERSPEWLGHSPVQPWAKSSLLLTAGPAFVVPWVFASAIRNTLLTVVEFFVLYLLTRREWLAVIAYLAYMFMLGFLVPSGEHRLALLVVNGVIEFCFLVVIMRLGVLALAAAWLTILVLESPVTFDAAAWYIGSSLVYLGLLLGIILYGFVVASGGQAFAWVRHLTGEAEAKA